MNMQTCVAEVHKQLNARECARILRVVGSIILPSNKPSDSFPYDIGSYFEEGEGCITYKPLLDGSMEMKFTPFNCKSRILSLEERVNRVEKFAAILREGFPQLANVVSLGTLQDAASVLGPIDLGER